MFPNNNTIMTSADKCESFVIYDIPFAPPPLSTGRRWLDAACGDGKLFLVGCDTWGNVASQRGRGLLFDIESGSFFHLPHNNQSQYWNAVAFIDGTFIVEGISPLTGSGSAGTSNFMFTISLSGELLSVTPRTIPWSVGGNIQIVNRATVLEYENNRLIAIDVRNFGRTAVSDDKGVSWVSVNLPFHTSLSRFTKFRYYKGYWYLVGGTWFESVWFRSADLETWYMLFTSENENIADLLFGNDIFVSVPGNFIFNTPPRSYFTRDMETFSAVFLSSRINPDAGGYFNAGVFAQGIFVMTGWAMVKGDEAVYRVAIWDGNDSSLMFGRFRNFFIDANPKIIGYKDPDNINPDEVLSLHKCDNGYYIPIKNGTQVIGKVIVVDEVICNTGIWSIPRAADISINENGVIALVGSAEDLLLYHIRLTSKYNKNFVEVGIGIHDDKPLEWQLKESTAFAAFIISTNNADMLIGSGGLVLRSIDGGNTWLQHIPWGGNHATSVTSSDNLSLILAGNISVSENGGDSWGWANLAWPGGGQVWIDLTYDETNGIFYAIAGHIGWFGDGYSAGFAFSNENTPYTWTLVDLRTVLNSVTLRLFSIDSHEGILIILASDRAIRRLILLKNNDEPWQIHDLPTYQNFEVVSAVILSGVIMVSYEGFGIQQGITRMVNTTDFITFNYEDLPLTHQGTQTLSKGHGRFVVVGRATDRTASGSFVTDKNLNWFEVYTPRTITTGTDGGHRVTTWFAVKASRSTNRFLSVFDGATMNEISGFIAVLDL
jgi:hypothetical protein